MEEALIKRVLPHSVEAEQSVIGAPFQLRKEIRAADPYRQRRSAHQTMQ